MVTRVLTLILTIATFVPVASARVINCPSCSWSDFGHHFYGKPELGIPPAEDGDTIVLPAGTATWGTPGTEHGTTIWLSKAITVVGQGDNTVITLDDNGPVYNMGVIWIGAKVTFRDIKIIGSSSRPVTAFQIVPYSSFTGGFRITGINFVGGTSDGYFAYTSSGVNSGLIDHCTITGNAGSAELIFGRGPDNAWQTANSMGGPDNIFVEDNIFNNSGYVCDANANARFVVRFNTINGDQKIDAHGMSSNSPPRSFRNIEAYRNHFTKTGTAGACIEIRGGTAMIFDNVSDYPNGVSGGWFILTDYGKAAIWPNQMIGPVALKSGNPTTITTPIPHGFASGYNVWVATPPVTGGYLVTVTSPTTFTIGAATVPADEGTFGGVGVYQTPINYPLKDQVGVGQDPKTAHSEPAYIWRNLKNGSAWARNLWLVPDGAINLYRTQVGDPAATFTEADIVKSNRDFFADAGFDTNAGVSIGTAAEKNALVPSIVGYGFWVTDEGEWNSKSPGPDGRLYVWNGSAWALKYTPYTYPHPLQAPKAPTGLRIIGN